MEWMGYLATLLMGITLGLVGGGGSILTVPILVYLFGIAPLLATAYSLFIVGSTSLLGGWGYHRRGDVDWRTGFTFAAPSFIGVYLTRAYVMPKVPDPVWQSASVALSKPILIMGVFAALMLLASWSMLKAPQVSSANPNTTPTHATRVLPKAGLALIALEGLLVGGVTGFVGAGGGFLIIPALVILVGLPMRAAVGTSLIIIAVKSLLGFLGDVQTQSNLQWGLLLSLSAVALVGMALGLRLAPQVSEVKLKRGFGWMVLLMGTLILIDQIRQMSLSGSGN
jgi:uncharacterized membrane protein YfcA